MQSRVIVNADDFGLSHEVNLAICEAFEKGYINRTTIMTNMPGFEEAVGLAKEYGFFGQVGLHINLFEGVPLTDEMKAEPLLYDEATGNMTSRVIFHEAPVSKKFRISVHTEKAIYDEVSAQAKRFIDARFPLMHFDSHGHAHTIWSFYRPIQKVAKINGFVTSRKSLNLTSYRTSLLKRLYKGIFNIYLCRDFASTDYFTEMDSFLNLAEEKRLSMKETYEIMVHPVYNGGVLVNSGRNSGFRMIEELEEMLQ